MPDPFDDVVEEYNRLAREDAEALREFNSDMRRTALDETHDNSLALEDAGLSPQEARVAALKTEGFTHKAIAPIVETSESTVDEYSRRAAEKIRGAYRLIDVVESIGLGEKYNPTSNY